MTCADCKFWEPVGDGGTGFCNRFPPVPIYDGHGVDSHWPETNAAHWCGEHQPKEKITP